MDKFKVCVTFREVVEVEAESEDGAVEKVRGQLISSKQLKPADPVEFSVITEITGAEVTETSETTETELT